MALTRKIQVRAVFILGLALLLCRAKGARRGLVDNGGAVFDVTQFGAVGDGKTDNAMSFIQAWNEACHSAGSSTVVIPQGQFAVGEVIFQGPCTSNPVTIQIIGTMLANPDLSLFSSKECFMINDVNGVIVTGGGTYDGQGQSAWKFDACGSADNCANRLPVSIKFSYVNNSRIENINLANSKGFHMTITSCSNFTAQGLQITAPSDSPNTDGIHVSRSNQVNVMGVTVGTGDDCISIGEGSTNVSVSNVTCGPGHGLSIGSLGKVGDDNVNGIHVFNCTLTNTTNGVRIKTFQNSPQMQASGIIFEDITMNAVHNPIIIDQNYHAKNIPQPSHVKITDVHFRNIRGTTISPIAVTLNCSTSDPCEGIEVADIDLAFTPGPDTNLNNLPLSSTCSNAKASFLGKLSPQPCK